MFVCVAEINQAAGKGDPWESESKVFFERESVKQEVTESKLRRSCSNEIFKYKIVHPVCFSLSSSHFLEDALSAIGYDRL